MGGRLHPLRIDRSRFRYRAMIGVGGIGSGTFFALTGNATLGREESRGGRFLDRRDYCKLHIICHYVRALLGPEFPTIPIGKVGDDESRDGAAADERLAARHVLRQHVCLRLHARDIGARAIDGDLVGTRVYCKERIAGLYDLSVGEVDLVDRAGDARPHLDALHGDEPTGEFVPMRNRFRERMRDGDAGSRRSRRRIPLRARPEANRDADGRKNAQSNPVNALQFAKPRPVHEYISNARKQGRGKAAEFRMLGQSPSPVHRPFPNMGAGSTSALQRFPALTWTYLLFCVIVSPRRVGVAIRATAAQQWLLRVNVYWRRQMRKIIAALALAGALAPSLAQAQVNIDMSKITCGEVLAMPADDQADFAAFIKRDVAKYQKLLRNADIHVE